MAPLVRALEHGNRTGMRQLRELGDELRERRLALGVTQLRVAEACGISRSRYTRIESGRVRTLAVLEVARLASVLGLDSVLRLYPGAPGIRDAGHSRRLAALLASVRAPLRFRVEVPLPPAGGVPERRAWDAVLYGNGHRTGIELEMRLRDIQATRRRHELKRRDDACERFLLIIADTRHNRRVVAELPELFSGLPRLRPTAVRAALEAGRHPPTGLLLV